MDIKIQVPGATLLHPVEDVVSSGSIVVFSGNTITFLLSEGTENTYRLEIELYDSPEGGAASIDSTPLRNALAGFGGLGAGFGALGGIGAVGTGLDTSSAYGSRLTLRNFGLQPVLATTSKIPITILGGKQVSLIFVVQSIGTARIFHYTLSR